MDQSERHVITFKNNLQKEWISNYSLKILNFVSFI